MKEKKAVKKINNFLEQLASLSAIRKLLSSLDSNNLSEYKSSACADFPTLVLRPTGNCSIYIGNIKCAQNFKLLKAVGVTHIINATKEYVNLFNFEEVKTLFCDATGLEETQLNNDEENEAETPLNLVLAMSCDSKKNGLKESKNLFQKYKSFMQESFKNGEQIKYLRIPVIDRPQENINEFFETAIDFIEEAIKISKRCRHEVKILIHCHAGVSRSTTICLAYLIYFYKLKDESKTFDEIYKSLLKKYPQANPNKGFLMQLENFHK